MPLQSFVTLAIFLFTCEVCAAAPEIELHQLRVTGFASYRCYAGYDGKRVTDERTKEICDNKTTKATLVDEVRSIEIKDEPDPDNAHSLGGGWLQTYDFKGRKFTIAISLFKEFGPDQYRLRIVAHDDEPQSRSTAVFVEASSLAELKPISIDYRSAGKKEEISFWVIVRHAHAEGVDAGTREGREQPKSTHGADVRK